ncbi:MAG: PEP-CTERM sorting domain-containing protein, partial [Nitrospirae bacterium]|nr:PEP-CTERM sorting domain-containing protein [Fimbriimonadaceae bacterium]
RGPPGGQVATAGAGRSTISRSAPVPEPGTMVVLSLGALGLVRRRANRWSAGRPKRSGRAADAARPIGEMC